MKKLIILVLTVALFLPLISCSDKEQNVQESLDVAPKETTEPVRSLEEDVTIEPEAPINSDEPLPDENETVATVSGLSGLPCSDEQRVSRPIAVMINNTKVSLPQSGISLADIVYECNAEGGVTRMMALFSDWQMISEIGTVRSAREYYVDLSQRHDAIFVHAGGSPSAYKAIKDTSCDNVDGVNMNDLPSKTFYRDSDRIARSGYEHSMMTGGSKIYRAVNMLEYRTEHTDSYSPYSFNESFEELVDCKKATKLTLKHSSYVTAEFDYDEKSNAWYKSSFGSPHVDADNGQQIRFENVIVILVNENVVDEEGRLEIDIDSGGKGYYFTGGGYTEIEWSPASNGAAFDFDKNGEKLLLNPGKTHITLFNNNHTKDIKIK